jgi:hypothetical protein
MGRPEEILRDYRALIDRHLEELVKGKAERMYEIEYFARALHIHPTHLTNTVVDLAEQFSNQFVADLRRLTDLAI